jgi:hypothetical protein
MVPSGRRGSHRRSRTPSRASPTPCSPRSARASFYVRIVAQCGPLDGRERAVARDPVLDHVAAHDRHQRVGPVTVVDLDWQRRVDGHESRIGLAHAERETAAVRTDGREVEALERAAQRGPAGVRGPLTVADLADDQGAQGAQALQKL